MPAENRKLASDGYGCDLMAPLGPDAHEEGTQRAGCLGRRPGRLDQRRARMAASNLADARCALWNYRRDFRRRKVINADPPMPITSRRYATRAQQAERNYARFVDRWKTRAPRGEVRERLNPARNE
jgi:hypothetical protein